MKKITVISLFLLGALNLITAQEQPFLDVNNPVLHYALNKKDTKYIEVKLLSQINDSNSTSCSKVFELEFTSVGKDLKLGTDFSTGRDGLQIRRSNTWGNQIFINKHTLASGSSETKTLAFVCTNKTEYADIVYGKAVIGQLDLSYDPSEYIAKEKARAEAKRKRLEEEKEQNLKRLYSSHTYEGVHSRNNAKCDSLLTPVCLANWVGASFFTKAV